MSIRRVLILIAGCVLIAAAWVPSGQAARRMPLEGVFIEARDLTPTEMAHVRRLARRTGKDPWLIYGFRYGVGAKSTPRRTRLEVYLHPDVESVPLRRGRVLFLEISAPAGKAGNTSSQLETPAKYAHVVVLGRRPDEVPSKWDPHRPFLVYGEMDDKTLLKLVAFIRTSPEEPRTSNGAPSARVSGSLAISHIRRSENRIEVTLNLNDYQGERAIVEEHNGHLVIVEHGVWIV